MHTPPDTMETFEMLFALLGLVTALLCPSQLPRDWIYTPRGVMFRTVAAWLYLTILDACRPEEKQEANPAEKQPVATSVDNPS